MGAKKEVTRKQTSLTLSEATMAELRFLIPDGQRSAFVEQVLSDSLRSLRRYMTALASKAPARV